MQQLALQPQPSWEISASLWRVNSCHSCTLCIENYLIERWRGAQYRASRAFSTNGTVLLKLSSYITTCTRTDPETAPGQSHRCDTQRISAFMAASTATGYEKRISKRQPGGTPRLQIGCMWVKFVDRWQTANC
jgi:hypothetical protein